MTVHVRLFASLRDAAGTALTTSEATTVDALLTDLADRYGEPFRTRLSRASVAIDGRTVDRSASLPDGCEVALLPPFAGGS